jgi:Fe-S cluster assembly iron-binding protein IscA
MLTVTGAAAEAISALSSAEGMGENGGLRFVVQSETDQGATLAVSVTSEPAAGDEVVTSDRGSHVFLDADAASYLDDKVLDVQPDEEGKISFAVLDQS